MKIQIELNKVKVEKNIPTSWKEVTFGQFLKIADAKDDHAKLISIFTDIPEETLKKAKISNLESLIALMSFMRTPMSLDLPDSVMGYKIPKSLELESIGQYQDLKLELADITAENGFHKYPLFCAIYATNPYDYQKAEELASTFLNAPCEEVVAVGNFTLLKLTGLMTNTALRLPTRSTPLKKLKLALTGWLRNLVFTLHYYTLKKRLHSIGKNS